MVDLFSTRKLDPVAKRLAASGDGQLPSVLEWLEGQNQRNAMRRRAVACAVGGWLLMTAAAIVSSIVAIRLSSDVREIFEEEFMPKSGVPLTAIYLPLLLVVVAVFLVVGGLVSWIRERVPVFSKTTSAIDWSSASDAVTRLLTAGCNYPEAFRTAAEVARSRPSRTWLTQAALRVERGGPNVCHSPYAHGDAAVLELMIDTTDVEPQLQWQVAADYFLELARRRSVLLLQTTPMIATIISGLLIWISISATLGWMWRSVAEMIRGLGV